MPLAGRARALKNADVRALPVMLGKRRQRLDDFFEVEGEGSEEVEIRGDASKVKWIGRDMTRGRIRVAGNAGMHLGAYMKGGAIEVTGHSADWVGGEMHGGTIHIRGNAGGQLGCAYRGSPSGMSGGTILVEGTAGIELGMRMKRGLIAVRGAVRDFAGLQMKGGTIVLMGGAELRTGAWMVRGTIISPQAGEDAADVLVRLHPQPAVRRSHAKHLAKLGFALPHDPREGVYRRTSATRRCRAGRTARLAATLSGSGTPIGVTQLGIRGTAEPIRERRKGCPTGSTA